MVSFASQFAKTLHSLSKPAKSRFICPLFRTAQYRIRDAVFSARTQVQCFSSVAEVSDFEIDDVGDDAKAKEKDMALSVALSQLEGDIDGDSALSLQRFFSPRDMPVISTGSLKLDLALGTGGLPKGRIVEIYGREASGKTTLALQVIKEAQKLGGYCAYFDVENAMDPTLAKSMGLKPEKLFIAPPDSAENLLSAVNTLTKSGSVDVIVVDSVAALLPHCEIDVPVGSTHRDVQSQIINQAVRKIHYSLCHSETLIIFVNQVRFNLKFSQGHRRMEEETCGGNAINFYAAVRLGIKRKCLLKSVDETSGLKVYVQVVKNKLAPAMKNAELNIEFGKGICCNSEILDLACEYGVIIREGSNYSIQGKAFDNMVAAQQYLAANRGIRQKIIAVLRKILFEGKK